MIDNDCPLSECNKVLLRPEKRDKNCMYVCMHAAWLMRGIAVGGLGAAGAAGTSSSVIALPFLTSIAGPLRLCPT